MEEYKGLATVAGLALFSLILVAFAQVPAILLIVPVLLVVAVVGNGMPMRSYVAQYDEQQARLKAKNQEARTANLEEAQAIKKHGIYIKPEFRDQYREEHADEYNRLSTAEEVNPYRVQR